MLELLGKKSGGLFGMSRSAPPSVLESKAAEQEKASLKQEVVQIPIHQIFLNPEQPR